MPSSTKANISSRVTSELAWSENLHASAPCAPTHSRMLDLRCRDDAVEARTERGEGHRRGDDTEKCGDNVGL